jgi:hypothetical protein
MPGRGLSWAAKLTEGAAATRVDAEGRFLVASYPKLGRLEVVDVLRHEAARRLEIGGRPGAVAFPPAGSRAWVPDTAGGPLRVIDVATGRALAQLRGVAGPQAVAFDRTGSVALIVGGGRDARAMLVDTAGLRALHTAPLAAAPVAVAYAPAAKRFVVAHADGRLSLLATRGTRLKVDRVMRIAAPGAGTTTVGVARDGHTAVALNTSANTLAVVDARRGKLLRTVETGVAPTGLAFLEHFALVRNARSADLTWVDLDEPSRSNNVTIGTAPAEGVFTSADGRSAFAPSPDDQRIYKLHTMMGRPMVMEDIPNSFRGDTVVQTAGTLQQAAGGAFVQRTLLEQPGQYRLRLKLPNGRSVTFQLPVTRADRDRAEAAPVRKLWNVRSGQTAMVRFRVRGAAPTDAQALAYLPSRTPAQLRAPARRVSGGIYEAALRFRQPGRYQLVLLSEQAGLRPERGATVAVRR